MLLKLAPRHTLYDVVTQRESIDEIMFEQAMTNHESGIRLLAGPPLFCDSGNVQTHVCQHILGLAQSVYPFVIVNTEDILHAEQVRRTGQQRGHCAHDAIGPGIALSGTAASSLFGRNHVLPNTSTWWR